jgi:hypothetical protein
MSGFFLVTRGITKHPLFKGKPDRLAVWMWLLDNVAWKDTTHDVKGHTVQVPRGYVCASERHIADECGVGYQVVRTAIKRFKSEHMVNAQPTHGKNLISLCNYEKHQVPVKTPNAQFNAQLTQPQRNPNAQKKQGNKVTRDTNVSQDARASLILSKICSGEVAQDFVAHRREMKKPLTERAAVAIAKKLEGHHAPDACLTDSIANGWQGVFPEKIKTQFTAITGGHNDKPSSKSQVRMDAFIGGARRTV